jgi:hypothetical protein
MPDLSDPIELTGGKQVCIRELDAIELLQATGYAGETPSGALINMTVNICTISKLKKGDGEWVDVYPCRSRAEFASLAKQISATDVVVLGAIVAARSIEQMNDEQKKALATNQGAPSEGPSPTG